MPAVLITGLTYVEHAVFFHSGGRAIASAHFVCPQGDSQAELAWVVD